MLNYPLCADISEPLSLLENDDDYYYYCTMVGGWVGGVRPLLAGGHSQYPILASRRSSSPSQNISTAGQKIFKLKAEYSKVIFVEIDTEGTIWS